MSSMLMRWKSKRWQRDWMVSGTLCGCVVASTNTTCGGGSSIVLSSALNAVGREHVDLVDDVDLVAPLGRREEHAADDLLANVVDAGARRGVELVDVGMAPLGDLDALLARAVGIGSRALLAVERLGEDARRGGLARAARPGEQVGVRDLAVGDRVSQRALDVLLTDDGVKRLRPVLAVEGLVRHAGPFEWA